jgi:hypothetical protein
VLIPRASHNFEFFAEVCQQMNGKTYPVDDKMLNSIAAISGTF